MIQVRKRIIEEPLKLPGEVCLSVKNVNNVNIVRSYLFEVRESIMVVLGAIDNEIYNLNKL